MIYYYILFDVSLCNTSAQMLNNTPKMLNYLLRKIISFTINNLSTYHLTS